MAPGLPEMLLWKSATVVGFFLLHYAHLYKKHLQRLVSAWQSQKLHVSMDPRQFRSAFDALSLCSAWLHLSLNPFNAVSCVKCGSVGKAQSHVHADCRGLEEIAAAEDHLHSGQSFGKLCVQVASELPASAHSKI